MRSTFLAILVTLAVVVGLYSLLQGETGYVLVAIAGYTIEMPFFLAIIIAVLFFLSLYILIGIVKGLLKTKSNIAGWANSKRKQRGLNRTTQGLIAFVEGRWDFARRSLSKAADNSSTPLINYLFAARASSQVGDSKAVDGFLKQAELSTEGAEVAIGLTQAELQIQNKQYEQALATLLRVKKRDSHHNLVLKLLTRVYRELCDWESLLNLIPSLRNTSMPEDEIDSYEQFACSELLKKSSGSSSELSNRWKHFPSSAKKRSVIVEDYALHLLNSGDHDAAESVLRQQLQRLYDVDLMRLYGRVNTAKPDKQLLFAEKFLSQRSNDPVLLQVSGMLSARSGKKQKAIDYLYQSLEANKSKEAYAELARIYSDDGEFMKGNEYYAKAMSLF